MNHLMGRILLSFVPPSNSLVNNLCVASGFQRYQDSVRCIVLIAAMVPGYCRKMTTANLDGLLTENGCFTPILDCKMLREEN